MGEAGSKLTHYRAVYAGWRLIWDWLPVDGASGDSPYSGILLPTAGLCTVFCDSVLFA